MKKLQDVFSSYVSGNISSNGVTILFSFPWSSSLHPCAAVFLSDCLLSVNINRMWEQHWLIIFSTKIRNTFFSGNNQTSTSSNAQSWLLWTFIWIDGPNQSGTLNNNMIFIIGTFELQKNYNIILLLIICQSLTKEETGKRYLIMSFLFKFF